MHLHQWICAIGGAAGGDEEARCALGDREVGIMPSKGA